MAEMLMRGGYKALTRLDTTEIAQEASILLLLANTLVYTSPDLNEAINLATRSADLFSASSCCWGQANALLVCALAQCGLGKPALAVENLHAALVLLGEPEVKARGDVKDAERFAIALVARGGALNVTCQVLWAVGFAYKDLGKDDLSLVAFKRGALLYRQANSGPACSDCGLVILKGGTFACMDCCVRVLCQECYVQCYSFSPDKALMLCHHSSRILRAGVAVDY
eukprot:CAMPEP_0173127952 /NCGR_PEP_ID=MMETSP1102-20130122/58179_1 /TAXON_ID=49646 /ORGANISM="Geminigera sp., Strain Caron Lab Isolate" /LENGTH=225 /DNA_ID=CAMNT_0014037831 /DNA_START=635 /DNA_END=1312 /DNA_ORIENTATION=+